MTIIRHYTPLSRLVHTEWVLLAVCLACTLAWVSAPLYRYDPLAPLLLRALSALLSQLAHLDTEHLLVNLLGLVLVGWGFRPWRTPTMDAAFLGCGAWGVATGLWLSPDVQWYCGLSGALHGYFMAWLIWVLLTDARPPVRRACWVLLAGAGIKLVMEDSAWLLDATTADWLELWGQPDDDARSGQRPVLYAAHRWGAAGGALAGLTGALYDGYRRGRIMRPRRTGDTD